MTERNRTTTPPQQRPSSDPSTNVPLNGPDVEPEVKGYQMAGEQVPSEQSAVFDADDVDTLGELTPTAVDEGELEAGFDDDLSQDTENIDVLTELELRAEETDDPMEAVEEGMTYVPPIDPPTVPGGYDNAEIASGLGVSALDEPYDADHHSTFLGGDDEMQGRVREALHADSSTTQYASRIAIEVRNGTVTLRGEVDDLVDSDNLLAVAEYVTGVEEVVDELRVRGLE